MRLLPVTVMAGSIVAAACAIAPPDKPPEVPAALQAPSGLQPHVEAYASGVQIYRCVLKADSTFDWVLEAPEATLVDRAGAPLGKHYAGPTWEALDGSTVVGEVKARDPGPDPSAIPWLLLKAKSHAGLGTFTPTQSIQRVATKGGLAPAGTCGAGSLERLTRVPYTATYYFYQ